MGKIFYTENSLYDSDSFIKKILAEFYGLENAVILRTENGKPYVENGPFFSVSHTANKLFVVLSSMNVGLDAELLSRKVNYTAIIKKFPFSEREEITCEKDFLYHWVAKESAVKYLGSTLARDLQNLTFQNGKLFYKTIELPVKLSFLILEDFLLAVCSENEPKDLPLILL